MLKKISSAMLILVFVLTMSISSCGKASDVDIMLAQYEKMMEKYMPLMEKASKGEAEGLDDEMAKMKKEMEEWGKKWEPKMKDLAPEEMAKVQKKMMEIAQKLNPNK